MVYRFYWQVLGDHTHVKVFAGPPMGLAGKLCFRNQEWQVLKQTLEASKDARQFEFVEETNDSADL